MFVTKHRIALKWTYKNFFGGSKLWRSSLTGNTCRNGTPNALRDPQEWQHILVAADEGIVKGTKEISTFAKLPNSKSNSTDVENQLM